MRLAIVAALALLLSGCGGEVADCLSAIEADRSHLSIDRNRSEMKRTDDTMDGLIVVRVKGTKTYQVKKASCEFRGSRLVSTSCPGCPRR